MLDKRMIVGRGLALLGALALSFAACEKRTPTPPSTPPSTPPGQPTDAPAAPDAVYVVRGRVTSMPDLKNPTAEFRVHHERIPDFKAPDGSVVGMNAMEMPFPVSDPKLLEGIQVGDVVEITFADWFKPMRTYKVTKVVKLPSDTELKLKKE